jgi:hypothetical protein
MRLKQDHGHLSLKGAEPPNLPSSGTEKFPDRCSEAEYPQEVEGSLGRLNLYHCLSKYQNSGKIRPDG